MLSRETLDASPDRFGRLVSNSGPQPLDAINPVELGELAQALLELVAAWVDARRLENQACSTKAMTPTSVTDSSGNVTDPCPSDHDVLTIADIAALWGSEVTFARSLVRKPGFPAPLPHRRGRWLRDEVLEFRKTGPRAPTDEPVVSEVKAARAPRGRITRSAAARRGAA